MNKLTKLLFGEPEVPGREDKIDDAVKQQKVRSDLTLKRVDRVLSEVRRTERIAARRARR